MRVLPAILLSGAAVLAQQPQSDLRVPRQPSGGDVVKAPPRPEVENGPATTLQVPTRTTPEVRPASPAVTKAIAGGRDDERVLVDRPDGAGGALWARGADYKASFAGDRWSFVARPATALATAQPLNLRLASARLGGEALMLEAAAVAVQEGNCVHLQHGAVRETVELRSRAVEQTFTFAELPRRGELVLTIDLDTSLVGEQFGAGLRFTGDGTDVRYSGAIAIDADGDRIAATTQLVGDHVEIRVPASFVATADLPLVIDPLVNSANVTSGTVDVGNPDVVYVPATGEWIATYQEIFAAGDWDCWVQRMSSTFQPVGARVAIDFTSNSFFRPRIAHLRYYGQSMVVGEVRFGTNPVKVRGRIVGNALALTTGQFDIATSTQDELVPDVGADSYNGTGYFSVVWEHAYSGTDHDIHARQVDSGGTLRGTAPTLIDTSTFYEANPTISKSDGGPTGASQLYAITYQRRSINSDFDIRGALMSWDGVVQVVAGATNFPIDSFSGSYSILPNVSSPTLLANGHRVFLCVYENAWSNNSDIEMAAFDETGTVLARGNVVQAEGSVLRLGWPQFFPAVDCDGTRFAVSYHENWNNSTTDLDARVTTISYGNGQLFAMDSALAGGTGNPEFAVQIASCYSSSAAQSSTYGTVNDKDAGGTLYIEGDRYDSAVTGLALVRPTTCGGGVFLSATGNPVPAGSMTFQITSTAPIAGFSAGTANSISLPGCSCIVGLDSYYTSIGTSLTLSIPGTPQIIGAAVSIQGWMLGAVGTSCLFDVHLSDTIDVTVR